MAQRYKRFRAIWATLADADARLRSARFLGLLFIATGFIMIGKAWDGAASINLRIDSQFPYLISGGIGGLGLILLGCTLLVLAALRAQQLDAARRLEELGQLLGRNLTRLELSSNGRPTTMVVPGESTYHLPGCSVLAGKESAAAIPLQQAVVEGLQACRVCDPPVPAERVNL
jgi:hypothetical protein